MLRDIPNEGCELTSPPTVVAAVTAEREAGLISPRLCSRKTREDRDRLDDDESLEEVVEIREEEDRRRENILSERE